MRAKKQTTRRLKDKNGRCCLGVACDVYKDTTKRGKWENVCHGSLFMEQGGQLPKKVYRWFGLSSSNPSLIYNNIAVDAITLNDNAGLNFKEIAKCIKDTFLNNKKGN